MGIVILGMYGVPIEKFSNGVESKVVEERLKVHAVRPAVDSGRDLVQEFLRVPPREIQIGYLIFGELRSHQGSRVFPYVQFGVSSAVFDAGSRVMRQVHH